MASDNRVTDFYSSRSGLAIDVSSADVVLSKPSRRIITATDGLISVVLLDDDDTNVLSLPVKAGIELHVRARTILSSGTSATGIVVLF